MLRTLFAVAVAAASTIAAPLKFGVEASLGYDIVSVGSSLKDRDSGLDSRAANFGVALGPNASWWFDDHVSIGAGVDLRYDRIGLEQDLPTGTSDIDMGILSLGFQIAPSYRFANGVSVKAGYEWVMPLTGNYSTDAGDMDVTWAPEKESDLATTTVFGVEIPNEVAVVSTHNLVFGGSYAINPRLAVTLEGKFALNGLLAEYDGDGDLKGAVASKSNYRFHQIAIGANYSFD